MGAKLLLRPRRPERITALKELPRIERRNGNVEVPASNRVNRSGRPATTGVLHGHARNDVGKRALKRPDVLGGRRRPPPTLESRHDGTLRRLGGGYPETSRHQIRATRRPPTRIPRRRPVHRPRRHADRLDRPPTKLDTTPRTRKTIRSSSPRRISSSLPTSTTIATARTARTIRARRTRARRPTQATDRLKPPSPTRLSRPRSRRRKR